MKTFKEMAKQKGLNTSNKFDDLLESDDDERFRDFKKKIKQACRAADIDIKMMSVLNKDDTFEIIMPLKKLIGPSTRKFCADRWNSFFENVGIEVDFEDNISEAIEGVNVSVPLLFDSESFKEIE